jgi:DNA-binding LacI/PurR family transcriptional regulator
LTETLSYAFSDAAAIGFMHGLTAGLEPLGLSVLLVPASPRQDASAVREAIVDGFIVYSMPTDHPHVLAMQERGVPVVMVDQPRTRDLPFVGIDNRAAARSVAEHVLSLGHRRLAVVAFPGTATPRRGPVSMEDQDAITREVTRDRLQGYRDAVEAAGFDWNRVRVEERLRSDAGEGLDAGRALLARSERPTAILAMSDQLALGVLQAAQECGLAVPSSLSIVGFDDIPAASISEPTLTTVRQPLVERGRLAAELLVSAMSGEGVDGAHHVLPTELVVRGSTAAPLPEGSAGT